MQAITNYFFKPVEEAKPEPETSWVKSAAYGSAGILASGALFALSVATTFSTALVLSALVPLSVPGGAFMLLYPASLLATYAVDKVALPLFQKAQGLEPQEVEEAPQKERSSLEALKHLALGVITSLAIWSLATVGSIFATGITLRLVLGRAVGGDLSRLFWILVAAPLAGSFLSIPAIHKVAGPHFQRGNVLS